MKKRLTKLVYVILLSISMSQYGFAQDQQFSQYYSSSLLINPAFAGASHYPHAFFHQRIQWPSLDAKYVTSVVGIDQYFEEYQSGVGAYFYRDQQGARNLSSLEFAMQYAYEVQLNEDLMMSLGLHAGIVNRRFDYSALQFSYQYTDLAGYDGSNNGLNNQALWFPDFGTGLLMFTSNFWFGTSFHHLSRPNQSVVGAKAPLPIRASFEMGYKIKLHTNPYKTFEDHEKDVSITPSVHYKFQGSSSQLDAGVYGIYDHLLVGAWYRGIPIKKTNNVQNNESLIFMVGWKVFLRMEIRYSYDWIISTLRRSGPGGAHELSASVLLRKSFKRRPKKRLPCPKHHIIKSYDF